MNSAERLAHLEVALERLRRTAEGAAVLVEGRRDVAALEALGVGGTHITLHRGIAIEALIDELARRTEEEGWPRLVLLLDWDRTGGRLMKRLRDGLMGRIGLDVECRRRLARAVHCKCVEDIPAEVATLRRQTV